MDKQIENERVRVVGEQVERLCTAVLELTKSVNDYKVDGNERRRIAERVERIVWDAKTAVSDLRDDSPETKDEHVEARLRGHSDERRQTHESFGCISFSRASGGRRLFGSRVKQHMHFITLRVSRAEAIFTNGDDEMRVWPSSRIDNEIVELTLSASQFAEAITAMNVGVGVPCTLNHVRGRRMADVPDFHEDRTDRVLNEMVADLRRTKHDNDAAYEKFKTALEASGLSKTKQSALLEIAAKMHETREGKAGFILERFNEAAEKTKANVMTELESMVTMATHHLGLERMRELGISKGHVDVAGIIEAKTGGEASEG